MSLNASIYLQCANSPNMENMIMFHDKIMMYILLITSIIMYIIFFMINNKNYNRSLLNNNNIEILWTFIPMIMLICIAFPSLKILYMNDQITSNPLLTIKCMGHQWYWSYEYDKFMIETYDSYMNSENFRLLDTDTRLILPFNFTIRMMVNSSDVIHSFSIPSLGMKIDAIPGRINQFNIFISRSGLYFGQCSEICGLNHSFMPIVIESVSIKNLLYFWFKY
uniref:Cytochrome c oxidase subunit 2 n=1 Tax=Ismarus sp. ZJUH_2016020 TaxID=2491162 RepID=A0A3Q8UA75_9HYME|nr:cytochrome c oxidase subunit 2 [Ismarus sp. ZJUH_2016020]